MTVFDAPLTIDKVDQYLLLLRDLTWRVLEGAEDHAGLKKRLGQLLKQGYPSQLQLPHAYLALLSHLLKFEPLSVHPHQLPNGAACSDALGLCTAAQVPELIQVAELGSLWMILGARLKNETLLYAGLKVALWQIHTLDHRGFPHLSLWARASTFKPPLLAAANHLLFSLAHRLTGEEGFYQAAQIQKHFGWDPASLSAKLLSLVPEKMDPPIKPLHRPFAEEMTLAMMKASNREWSMAYSLSGSNSGLFSYHRSQTAIVNAGPQVGPLDSLENFGIDRSCSLSTRQFSEIEWEKNSHYFKFKGWTKPFAHPAWIEMSALYEAQKLSLSFLLQEGRPSDDLSMVFYVQCDQLAIGGKTTLQAGSLERYQGKSAPLELKSASETIYMEPSEQEMQIIPLAGGDHFWGAHFLISFPLTDVFQALIQ